MEERRCPAREGHRECCYAEGHEERSGMPHRFVVPNYMLDQVLDNDLDDVEARMRRAWRETGKIDNGEDDA